MLDGNRHHSIYLQNSWNKHGEDSFVFNILKTFNTGDEDTDLYLATRLEQHFLDSFAIGRDLYNISSNATTGVVRGEAHSNYGRHPREWLGEEGFKKMTLYIKNRDFTGENSPFYGKTHTEETRKTISLHCANFGEDNGFYGKTHSEETVSMLSHNASLRVGKLNPFYGRTHTEETKKSIGRAISLATKGVPKTEEAKQNMRKASPRNTVVEIDGVIYISFRDAERLTGVGRKIIASRARSENPKYSNYRLL